MRADVLCNWSKTGDRMRSSARIAPGLDIAPEQARDARARAWKFVFDCHAKNATSVPGANGGEDVRLANKERRSA